MKKLLFLPLLLLGACGADPIIDDWAEGQESDKVDVTHFVSMGDAMEKAKGYRAGMSKTRGEDFNASSFTTYGAMPTRGGENCDTTSLWGYYVFNFSNDEGFAIVSADDRNQELYAISDEGRFEMADTVDNVGLRDYLHALPVSVSDLGETWTPPTTPVIILPSPNPDPIDPPCGVEVAPLLEYNVRNWGQREPFNALCINANNPSVRDLVGCAALSTAMIMSHFEWPKSYLEKNLDWRDMKDNHSNNTLAWLLRRLGDSENLHISYSPTFSGAFAYTFPRTFYNLGYERPEFVSFSLATALSTLRHGAPMLIIGVDKAAGGHAWCLDGIYWTQRIIPDLAVPQRTTKDYYIHCVWGWYATSNGYYSFNDNVVSGYAKAHASGDESSKLPHTFSELELLLGVKVR